MSGLPPPAHVEPAPYALQPGVPALQVNPAQTRRGFLFSAIGGLVAGVSLTALWSRDGAAAAPAHARPGDPRLAWLIRSLHAPHDVLVEQHEMLLALASQFRDVPEVRDGIRRLSAAALAGRTRRHEQLSVRLLDYLALEPDSDELRRDLARFVEQQAGEGR